MVSVVYIIFLCGCASEIGGRLPIIGFADGFVWEISPDYIRVVISAPGFSGYFHESVEITCSGAFSVYDGESVLCFRAGDVFRHVSDENENAFIITPDNRNECLEFIGRGTYRGILEISRAAEGFVIVNELPLEEYLYAVVPSEMPSSYGVQASMVQAVTARTFAYYQMRENRFAEFGAHVDDSVMSQVYNNIAENEISIEAVQATRGQVLTYNGEIVLANYFSTSGGTTANFGEVWASGEQFPSETPEFLRARAQFLAHVPGDLRTEAAAAEFFRNKEIPAFDRDFSWFRWEVTMTVAQLSERINSALPERYAANPAMIYFSTSADNIGTLTDIEVTRRGQGGNIMEIIFHGTNASVRVETEYNIRALLNPREIPVTRHDGSQSGRLSLLPSAFFTTELHYDATNQLIAATFYGGGNGHGVGMSQNGVRALLDMGLTYIEILQHYYPGTEITSSLLLHCGVFY
ncbi:MAG: SpoIID/LytB domain-containing protein [Clostridiales bacterium]|nr:SpoIID/LytB domain-containing protein [Clostridiales bacterium]